jgi:hypothetical protein
LSLSLSLSLSADPDLFATTGDDKTIRIWSIGGRRLLRKAVIDSTARSVHWSPDGELLLVGLGGSQDGKKQRKDGAFLMLDARTMKPLFEGRYVPQRHWIPRSSIYLHLPIYLPMVQYQLFPWVAIVCMVSHSWMNCD